jgi:aconitase B
MLLNLRCFISLKEIMFSRVESLRFIGTLTADQSFTFTDWTAEMKAKASICISEDATLIESLEIAKVESDHD